MLLMGKGIPYVCLIWTILLYCSLKLVILKIQKRKLKIGDVSVEKKKKLLNGEAEKSFKKPKMPADKEKQKKSVLCFI